MSRACRVVAEETPSALRILDVASASNTVSGILGSDRSRRGWTSSDLDSFVVAHRAVIDRLRAAADASARAEDFDELQRLVRALVQTGVLARQRAQERVYSASERIAAAGSVSEIVDRTPHEVARALELDRVLLSRVSNGTLVVEAVHSWQGVDASGELLGSLQLEPVTLAYPLVEAEMLRRRHALVVECAADVEPERHAFAPIVEWSRYVAAPVIIGSRVVGFIHGDRRNGGAPLGWVERDALSRFAALFAGVFERAELRRRLRAQQRDLQVIVDWVEGKVEETVDRAIDLSIDRDHPVAARILHDATPAPALRGQLTPREREILDLMASGATNPAIARELVLSVGTVKFHVKNILRKLGVANRAEATSHYVRLTSRD